MRYIAYCLVGVCVRARVCGGVGGWVVGGLWNHFTAFNRHDLPHSKKFTGTKKF